LPDQTTTRSGLHLHPVQLNPFLLSALCPFLTPGVGCGPNFRPRHYKQIYIAFRSPTPPQLIYGLLSLGRALGDVPVGILVCAEASFDPQVPYCPAVQLAPAAAWSWSVRGKVDENRPVDSHQGCLKHHLNITCRWWPRSVKSDVSLINPFIKSGSEKSVCGLFALARRHEG
jgi:hypothetical protein